MIRTKDKPYIQAMRELCQKETVTSNEIDMIVNNINLTTGICYDGRQVINILTFCDLITIQTHLGQPRHGNIINSGRLHQIRFLSTA